MKYRIEQDHDPMNPREEFDHLGVMVCFHRRYTLGDEHDYEAADYEGWDEVVKAIQDEEKPVVVLPLYLYDHGGITMRTGSFSCPWDSGQVGFIFARREDVLKEYGKKRISKKLRDEVTKRLEAEVKEYDQYLTGDVWGYIIEDDHGEELDSCWGFFGHDYCEEEAKAQLEYYDNLERAKPPSMVPAPVCAAV
jgi:hypothetical protein